MGMAGTQNLGNASYYWNDISYKTLTDRGCIVEIYPMLAIQYLKSIKAHAMKYTDLEKLKKEDLKIKLLCNDHVRVEVSPQHRGAS